MRRLHLAFLICAALALPRSASAVCTLGAISGANFGVYDPAAAAPLTTVINGSFSCSTASTITVSTGSSGTYAVRTMLNGTQSLQYNVYLDPAFTVILGDGQPGTAMYPVPPGTNTPITVYGRIPALQDVAWGTYSDTLIVTFTF